MRLFVGGNKCSPPTPLLPCFLNITLFSLPLSPSLCFVLNAYHFKPVLQYIIFPAQFAFLYSYYPSGRLDEVAKKLTTEWRTRHVESSEQAFTMKEEGFVRNTGPSFFQKSESIAETVLAAVRKGGKK
jgi:hypothetical protein